MGRKRLEKPKSIFKIERTRLLLLIIVSPLLFLLLFRKKKNLFTFRYIHRAGVSSIQAILITHHHGDAILAGPDDLRGLQPYSKNVYDMGDGKTSYGYIIHSGPTEIIASAHTMEVGPKAH